MVSAGNKIPTREKRRRQKGNPYLQQNKQKDKSDTIIMNQNEQNQNESPTQTWYGKFDATSDECYNIGFGNLNGLAKGKQKSISDSLKDLATTLRYHNISLFGITEHHLAMNNPGIPERINTIEKQLHKNNRIKCFFHSSQEITENNARLMGGTGIVMTKESIGRLQPNGHGGDDMGRWTYVHLKIGMNRTLTIISVYQVCQTPTNKIGGTAWHQQRRHLDLQTRTEEHPREAFMKDLSELIKEFQDKNHEIIVGGDWNETIQGTNSKLLKLSTERALTDPWIHQQNEHHEIATHERGTTRIDSILVSHSILPYVESISYSPVGLISNSDHRTVLLQLSQSRLFGNKVNKMTVLQERNLKSNDRKAVTTFIETMYAHLQANSAFRLARLLKTDIDDNGTLVENIDKLIGQAGDIAEKKCKRRRPEWFSIPLTQQRLTVSYLRYVHRGDRIEIDRRPITSKGLYTVMVLFILSIADFEIPCGSDL